MHPPFSDPAPEPALSGRFRRKVRPDSLIAAGLDWSRITIFHLDEYIDLPETHPACRAGSCPVGDPCHSRPQCPAGTPRGSVRFLRDLRRMMSASG